MALFRLYRLWYSDIQKYQYWLIAKQLHVYPGQGMLSAKLKAFYFNIEVVL